VSDVLWRDHPLLGPAQSMPTHFWGPEDLDHQAWMEFAGRLDTAREIDMLLAALDGSTSVLDVGGGTGTLTTAVANKLGRCVVVEPSTAQAARIQAAPGSIIDVLPGRGEALPVADGAFDAVMATWVLQYTHDPFVAVAEMARACIDRSGGRVVLVQAAPGNSMVDIYNAEAKIAGLPRAHHGWLLAGATDILEMRGFSITLAGVRSAVKFPEADPGAAASLLQRLHFAGHPRADAMRAETTPMIAEMFARTPGELSDVGVLLIARR
jgi:SAM-dependent methyltransferase